MRLKIVLCLFAASLLFVQCREDYGSTLEVVELGGVRFFGGTCTAFSDDTTARSYEDTELDEGSQMSLYSTGGLVADGILFTLTGGEWVNDSVSLRWTSQVDAQIVAFCPPVTEETALYDDDGFLIDWLSCSKSVSYCDAVQLEFEHITSQICFKADENLNDSIQEIHFTPSLRMTAIDTSSGDVSCDSADLTTVTFDRQDGADYTFNVPSGYDMTVDISLTTLGGRTLRAKTTEMTFSKGVRYVCNVGMDESDVVGISTREDFIAFTYLINGMEYEGRSLSEFGVSDDDGSTTYRLLCDIDFTADTCQVVQTIGSSGSQFCDIFDGGGHKISGLIFEESPAEKNYGLFNYIGEDGTVKNLTLEYAQMDCSSSGSINNVGMLCGVNYGIVENCMMDTCTVNAVSSVAGCMVGLNRGNIVNSCVIRSRLYNDSESDLIAAGMVGQNYGNIVNCYVAWAYIYSSSTAGICGKMYESSSTMTNVYAYKITKTSGNKHGGVVYSHSGGTYRNCFSGSSAAVYGSGLPDGTYQFTQETGDVPKYDGATLDSIFNSWIDSYAETVYPDLELYQWSESSTIIPYVFVSD